MTLRNSVHIASPNDSDAHNTVPSRFFLSQNYPNPFSDRTTIKFCVPYTVKVKLTVYDAEGAEVAVLMDREKKAGTYKVEFLPGEGGGHMLSRQYLYRMEAGRFFSEKKMDMSNL